MMIIKDIRYIIEYMQVLEKAVDTSVGIEGLDTLYRDYFLRLRKARLVLENKEEPRLCKCIDSRIGDIF